jgi:hypothetical protein
MNMNYSYLLASPSSVNSYGGRLSGSSSSARNIKHNTCLHTSAYLFTVVISIQLLNGICVSRSTSFLFASDNASKPTTSGRHGTGHPESSNRMPCTTPAYVAHPHPPGQSNPVTPSGPTLLNVPLTLHAVTMHWVPWIPRAR